jgi:hypothetical protein
LAVRIVMSRKQDTASRRGADEIVEEIVDHLRPWKAHKSVATITAAVNQRLVQASESSELILVWQPNRFRHPKAP